jgi:hypothetical protein
MRFLILTLLLLNCLSVSAQKILARYPAIHYTSFPLKPLIEGDSAHPSFTGEIGSLAHEDKYTYSIFIRPDAKKEVSWITVKRNGRTELKVEEPTGLDSFTLDSVYTADINGDSFVDIKLVIPMHTTKANPVNVTEVYLFQHLKNNFTKISFGDIGGRPERDMNSDGNYEIVTRSLRPFEGHTYWIFNVYEYTNDDLVNVSNKYGYPKMVQVGRSSVAKNVPVTLQKSFSPVYPVGYDKR